MIGGQRFFHQHVNVGFDQGPRDGMVQGRGRGHDGGVQRTEQPMVVLHGPRPAFRRDGLAGRRTRVHHGD